MGNQECVMGEFVNWGNNDWGGEEHNVKNKKCETYDFSKGGSKPISMYRHATQALFGAARDIEAIDHGGLGELRSSLAIQATNVFSLLYTVSLCRWR